MMPPSSRISELGLTLPPIEPPLASFVPLAETGNIIFMSGQLPVGPDGAPICGRLGETMTLDDGAAAARACALMLVAQLATAGLLDRVSRILRLGVFVASAPHFTEQSCVANGASDLIVDVFGDAGRHARTAIGVPVLPFGIAVEVDAVIGLTAR